MGAYLQDLFIVNDSSLICILCHNSWSSHSHARDYEHFTWKPLANCVNWLMNKQFSWSVCNVLVLQHTVMYLKNWNVCLKMNTCDISCCGLMYRLISWLINRLNNWLVCSVYLSWYLWSDTDMCALSYRFRPQVLCVWLHNASRCGLWQQHTAWL